MQIVKGLKWDVSTLKCVKFEMKYTWTSFQLSENHFIERGPYTKRFVNQNSRCKKTYQCVPHIPFQIIGA